MRTFCRIPYEHDAPLPEWTVDEVRFPPAYVERFLAEFTDPGDVVLDPFAGFGTTLRVATEMGREAYGIEYEERRVEYVRERGGAVGDRAAERASGDSREQGGIEFGAIVHGDARDPAAFDALDLPPIDCCLTSPPWMVERMEVAPLTNYENEGDYEGYLGDVADVFSQVADRLAPGGVALVDAANVKFEGEVTTLAWDLADAIGEVLHFDGEVVVEWETDGETSAAGIFGTGYDHNYCLTFSTEDGE